MLSNLINKFKSSGVDRDKEILRQYKAQPTQPLQPSRKKLKQVKIYLNHLDTTPLMYEIQDNSRGLDVIKFALSTNKLIIHNPRNKVNLYEINSHLRRSVRNFEKLYDITDNWSDDDSNGCFLIDSHSNYLKDSLSERKSRDAVIEYSTTVQMQVSPGKWSKRYLQLFNDTLHLSKSDKAKDKHFICNMVSYDVYTLTKLYPGAPKPQRIFDDTLYGHIFVVKSQDNSSLFEKKEDYSHVFAVTDSHACRDWVKALTQSRTHALIHERPWLFKHPRESRGHHKTVTESSPEFNTKLTPTKSISRSKSQSRPTAAATDNTLARSRSQVRSHDASLSRSKSQMRPRKGSDHHSPHSQTKLVQLTDESIFTQGSLLARRESEKDKGSPSFLKHDPSIKSTKSNITRKRSGTVNSISNYPTSRSR